MTEHELSDGSDAIFWERIAEMPWVEAEQECVQRREELSQQVAMLTDEIRQLDRGVLRNKRLFEKEGIYAQLTMVNERIKYLRKVQDRVEWRKAVTAIFGQDGFERCAEWIITTEQHIRHREQPK